MCTEVLFFRLVPQFMQHRFMFVSAAAHSAVCRNNRAQLNLKHKCNHQSIINYNNYLVAIKIDVLLCIEKPFTTNRKTYKYTCTCTTKKNSCACTNMLKHCMYMHCANTATLAAAFVREPTTMLRAAYRCKQEIRTRNTIKAGS